MLGVFEPPRSEYIGVPHILMLNPLIPTAKAPASRTKILAINITIILLQNPINFTESLESWRQGGEEEGRLGLGWVADVGVAVVCGLIRG